jgi:hypothetical protein
MIGAWTHTTDRQCGDKLLNGLGNKVTESQCNTVCPGDNKQKCGGAYRNSRTFQTSPDKHLSLSASLWHPAAYGGKDIHISRSKADE